MSTATISLLVACSVLLVALSVAASQPASPNSAIVLVNGLPGKANAYFGGSPVVFSFQVDKIVASQRLQLGFWFAPAAFYAQVDSIPTPSNFSWNLTIATQHTFIPTIDIAPNSPGFTVGTLYIAGYSIDARNNPSTLWVTASSGSLGPSSSAPGKGSLETGVERTDKIQPGYSAYYKMHYNGLWSSVLALQFFATCTGGSSSPLIYVSNYVGSVRPSSASFDWHSTSPRPGSAVVTLPLSDTKYVYNYDSTVHVAVYNPGPHAMACTLLPVFDNSVEPIFTDKPAVFYLKGDILEYYAYTYTPQTRNRTLTVNFKFSTGGHLQVVGAAYASFQCSRPSPHNHEYHKGSDMHGVANLMIPASDVPRQPNPVLWITAVSPTGYSTKAEFSISSS